MRGAEVLLLLLHATTASALDCTVCSTACCSACPVESGAIFSCPEAGCELDHKKQLCRSTRLGRPQSPSRRALNDNAGAPGPLFNGRKIIGMFLVGAGLMVAAGAGLGGGGMLVGAAS